MEPVEILFDGALDHDSYDGVTNSSENVFNQEEVRLKTHQIVVSMIFNICINDLQDYNYYERQNSSIGNPDPSG